MHHTTLRTLIALHHTTPHTTHYTLRYATLIALHNTTLISLHYTTQHHMTRHDTTLHCTALHYTTTRLHYTTLHYTTLPKLHYITLHSLHHPKCNCSYTTLITLHHKYNSTTLQLQLQLRYTTLHSAVVGEVTDQVTIATIAVTPKNTVPTTFRSISGFALPSVIHRTNLSYRLPVFETSTSALCGTIGIYHKHS